MGIRANRAAQFLPFDSLKGFAERINQVEEELSRIEKIEVCEGGEIEISNTLSKLEKGYKLEVVFYRSGRYVSLSGTVSIINTAFKFLIIDGVKVCFDDIYTITII